MTELDANYYRSHSSIQYNLASEFFSQASFKEKDIIFDIGCAEGRISSELSFYVPQGKVIGIDPSASMIDLAKASFKERSNLEFMQGSAESFTSREYADKAFLLNALHWIRDPLAAFNNIASQMRSGGKLFILTYPKESTYWHFLDETAQKPCWKAYQDRLATHTIFTSVEYQNLLKKAGFLIEERRLNQAMAVYETIQDLQDYIRGWLSCYLPLPVDLQQQFLKEASQQAIKHSVNELAYPLEIPYCKWNVIAKKTNI